MGAVYCAGFAIGVTGGAAAFNFKKGTFLTFATGIVEKEASSKVTRGAV